MDKHILDNRIDEPTAEPQDLQNLIPESNQTSPKGEKTKPSYYNIAPLTEKELEDINAFRALKGLPPVTE